MDERLKALLSDILKHYEPDAEVSDEYFQDILNKRQGDAKKLVSDMIKHYEPDAEVSDEYLNRISQKYNMNLVTPSLAASTQQPTKEQEGNVDTQKVINEMQARQEQQKTATPAQVPALATTDITTPESPKDTPDLASTSPQLTPEQLQVMEKLQQKIQLLQNKEVPKLAQTGITPTEQQVAAIETPIEEDATIKGLKMHNELIYKKALEFSKKITTKEDAQKILEENKELLQDQEAMSAYEIYSNAIKSQDKLIAAKYENEFKKLPKEVQQKALQVDNLRAVGELENNFDQIKSARIKQLRQTYKDDNEIANRFNAIAPVLSKQNQERLREIDFLRKRAEMAEFTLNGLNRKNLSPQAIDAMQQIIDNYNNIPESEKQTLEMLPQLLQEANDIQGYFKAKKDAKVQAFKVGAKLALQKSVGERGLGDKEFAFIQEQNEYAEQFQNKIAQGFLGAFGDLSKQIAIGSKYLSTVTGLGEEKDKRVQDLATYKFGQKIQDFAKNTFYDNPDWEDSFWLSTIPQGTGFIGSMMVGGMSKSIGSAANLSKVTTAFQAAPELTKQIVGTMLSTPVANVMLGSSVMGVQGYEEAMAMTNGDEDKAFKAWLANSVIGTSEALVYQAGGRIMQSAFGKATAKIAESRIGQSIAAYENIQLGNAMSLINKFSNGVYGRAVMGGVEESMQEGVTQILTNYTAKEIYDINRQITQGMGESVAAGMILGTFFSAMRGGLQNKIANATNDIEKAELQAVLDNIDETEAKIQENTTEKSFEKQEKGEKIKFNNEKIAKLQERLAYFEEIGDEAEIKTTKTLIEGYQKENEQLQATEAPTTEAPTTEAPTAEAPTVKESTPEVKELKTTIIDGKKQIELQLKAKQETLGQLEASISTKLGEETKATNLIQQEVDKLRAEIENLTKQLANFDQQEKVIDTLETEANELQNEADQETLPAVKNVFQQRIDALNSQLATYGQEVVSEAAKIVRENIVEPTEETPTTTVPTPTTTEAVTKEDVVVTPPPPSTEPTIEPTKEQNSLDFDVESMDNEALGNKLKELQELKNKATEKEDIADIEASIQEVEDALAEIEDQAETFELSALENATPEKTVETFGKIFSGDKKEATTQKEAIKNKLKTENVTIKIGTIELTLPKGTDIDSDKELVEKAKLTIGGAIMAGAKSPNTIKGILSGNVNAFKEVKTQVEKVKKAYERLQKKKASEIGEIKRRKKLNKGELVVAKRKSPNVVKTLQNFALREATDFLQSLVGLGKKVSANVEKAGIEFYQAVVGESTSPTEIANAYREAKQTANDLSETDLGYIVGEYFSNGGKILYTTKIETILGKDTKVIEGEARDIAKKIEGIKASKYMAEKGSKNSDKAKSLEDLVKSFSDRIGKQVEINDILDVFDDFLRGNNSYTTYNQVITDLAKKFRDITGMPLTTNYANKLAEVESKVSESQTEQEKRKASREQGILELDNKLVELQGSFDAAQYEQANGLFDTEKMLADLDSRKNIALLGELFLNNPNPTEADEALIRNTILDYQENIAPLIQNAIKEFNENPLLDETDVNQTVEDLIQQYNEKAKARKQEVQEQAQQGVSVSPTPQVIGGTTTKGTEKKLGGKGREVLFRELTTRAFFEATKKGIDNVLSEVIIFRDKLNNSDFTKGKLYSSVIPPKVLVSIYKGSLDILIAALEVAKTATNVAEVMTNAVNDMVADMRSKYSEITDTEIDGILNEITTNIESVSQFITKSTTEGEGIDVAEITDTTNLNEATADLPPTPSTPTVVPTPITPTGTSTTTPPSPPPPAGEPTLAEKAEKGSLRERGLSKFMRTTNLVNDVINFAFNSPMQVYRQMNYGEFLKGIQEQVEPIINRAVTEALERGDGDILKDAEVMNLVNKAKEYIVDAKGTPYASLGEIAEGLVMGHIFAKLSDMSIDPKLKESYNKTATEIISNVSAKMTYAGRMGGIRMAFGAILAFDEAVVARFANDLLEILRNDPARMKAFEETAKKGDAAQEVLDEATQEVAAAMVDLMDKQQEQFFDALQQEMNKVTKKGLAANIKQAVKKFINEVNSTNKYFKISNANLEAWLAKIKESEDLAKSGKLFATAAPLLGTAVKLAGLSVAVAADLVNASAAVIEKTIRVAIAEGKNKKDIVNLLTTDNLSAALKLSLSSDNAGLLKTYYGESLELGKEAILKKATESLKSKDAKEVAMAKEIIAILNDTPKFAEAVKAAKKVRKDTLDALIKQAIADGDYSVAGIEKRLLASGMFTAENAQNAKALAEYVIPALKLNLRKAMKENRLDKTVYEKLEKGFNSLLSASEQKGVKSNLFFSKLTKSLERLNMKKSQPQDVVSLKGTINDFLKSNPTKLDVNGLMDFLRTEKGLDDQQLTELRDNYGKDLQAEIDKAKKALNDKLRADSFFAKLFPFGSSLAAIEKRANERGKTKVRETITLVNVLNSMLKNDIDFAELSNELYKAMIKQTEAYNSQNPDKATPIDDKFEKTSQQEIKDFLAKHGKQIEGIFDTMQKSQKAAKSMADRFKRGLESYGKGLRSGRPEFTMQDSLDSYFETIKGDKTKMSVEDFVDYVAKKYDITKTEAQEIKDTMRSRIEDVLNKYAEKQELTGVRKLTNDIKRIYNKRVNAAANIMLNSKGEEGVPAKLDSLMNEYLLADPTKEMDLYDFIDFAAEKLGLSGTDFTLIEYLQSTVINDDSDVTLIDEIQRELKNRQLAFDNMYELMEQASSLLPNFNEIQQKQKQVEQRGLEQMQVKTLMTILENMAKLGEGFDKLYDYLPNQVMRSVFENNPRVLTLTDTMRQSIQDNVNEYIARHEKELRELYEGIKKSKTPRPLAETILRKWALGENIKDTQSFAELFGMPVSRAALLEKDGEVRKKIAEMVEEIKKYPAKSVYQNVEIDKLMHYIEGFQPPNGMSMLRAGYFTAVLSGFITASVNTYEASVGSLNKIILNNLILPHYYKRGFTENKPYKITLDDLKSGIMQGFLTAFDILKRGEQVANDITGFTETKDWFKELKQREYKPAFKSLDKAIDEMNANNIVKEVVRVFTGAYMFRVGKAIEAFNYHINDRIAMRQNAAVRLRNQVRPDIEAKIRASNPSISNKQLETLVRNELDKEITNEKVTEFIYGTDDIKNQAIAQAMKERFGIENTDEALKKFANISGNELLLAKKRVNQVMAELMNKQELVEESQQDAMESIYRTPARGLGGYLATVTTNFVNRSPITQFLFSFMLDMNFFNILGHVFNNFVNSMPVASLYRTMGLKETKFFGEHIPILSVARKAVIADMDRIGIKSSTIGEKGSIGRDMQYAQNMTATLWFLFLLAWYYDNEDDDWRSSILKVSGRDLGKTEKDKKIRGDMRPRNTIELLGGFLPDAITPRIPEWLTPTWGASAALVGNYVEHKKQFKREAVVYEPPIDFTDKLMFALKAGLDTGVDFMQYATPFKSAIQTYKEQKYIAEDEGLGETIKPFVMTGVRKLGGFIPNQFKQLGDVIGGISGEGKQSAKPKDFLSTVAMATGIYRFTPSDWYNVQKAYDVFGEPVKYLAGEQYMPASHWGFVTNKAKESYKYELVYDRLGMDAGDLPTIKKTQKVSIVDSNGIRKEVPIGDDFKLHEKAILKTGKLFSELLQEAISDGKFKGIKKEKGKELVKELYKEAKEKALSDL